MEVSDSSNRSKANPNSDSAYSGHCGVEGLGGLAFVHDQVDLAFSLDGPQNKIEKTSFHHSFDADFSEEIDFSDAALRYINQVLMEDDLDDKDGMIQDSTLFAAQKSFYDVLNNAFDSQVHTSSDANVSISRINYGEGSVDACKLVEAGKIYESSKFFGNTHLEKRENSKFKEGVKERRILPSDNGGISDFEDDRSVTFELGKEGTKGKPESNSLQRGRSLHRDESDLEEGRSHKHLEVFPEQSVLLEMFNEILLFKDEKDESAQNSLDAAGRESHRDGQDKESNCGMSSTKKGVRRREAIDTRSLLIQCMEAIASNDQRKADNLLKQIRRRSSPSGDASQRLAHCFANGLEARIAGTGSLKYRDLVAKNMTTADALKAYRLYMSALPFMKASNYFATHTIVKLAVKATTLHIIHFGIMHGVQLATLIQNLSTRPGGPPKLRVTGIDFPKQGFRPAEVVEETGRRLASCCKRLDVPFEYTPIAQKWETLRLEDFKIEKDEVLVVYCCYRFHFLLDYTILENSPRDAVLDLIRRINPDVFIHGVTNGAFNSPFFMSRFKEALSYYATLFDMFEANMAREDKDRMVYETEIYGKEVLNVIACEGLERVERPETYKQWQVRTLRAGFKQLPLNQEITRKVKAKVKLSYHKDFFVDESNRWLIHGWKGRVLFALSCWKPA